VARNTDWTDRWTLRIGALGIVRTTHERTEGGS